MSIFDKLVGGPLGRYASYAHGYFAFPKLEGQLGNHMVFKGKEVICWSINNYLGLANHPEVREIDNEAMKEWGMAYPMGSRILTGETTYHEKLEKSLAEFVDKEAAMLLNYGYQGIMSVIDTVLGRNDVVVYDKECHACIYDGVRMHVGKRLPFEHNDMDSLRAQLVKATELVKARKGGILVISEGVFGMKGDQGKLREIVQMKEEFDFQLLVDDAHGFGTLGETGMGTGEEQGVQEEIDLYFTTFAKSMASLGAFVAGPKEVITFLKYNARSQVFAKTLPMAVVIGNMKRLELLRNNPTFKDRLWRNVRALQKGLREKKLDIGNTNSCVTPVILKASVGEASELVKDLRENHAIFCSMVFYPVIPKGTVILRLIPTASHSMEDVERTVQAFGDIADKLFRGDYRNEYVDSM